MSVELEKWLQKAAITGIRHNYDIDLSTDILVKYRGNSEMFIKEVENLSRNT